MVESPFFFKAGCVVVFYRGRSDENLQLVDFTWTAAVVISYKVLFGVNIIILFLYYETSITTAVGDVKSTNLRFRFFPAIACNKKHH